MNAVENAVRTVAEAERHARKTSEMLAVAEATVNTLRDRDAALDAERVAIVTARQSGAIDPGQGPRLHEIAADRESLEEMISEADRAAAPLRVAAGDAARAATMARSMLEREKSAEYLGRLVDHATTLDKLLVTTMAEVATATAAIGEQRPVWYPSAPLVEQTRRLVLVADQLGVALR